MITRKSSFRILAALLALLAVTAYAKKQELPEVTTDGLHRVPDSKLAVVYAEPGADLSPYKRALSLFRSSRSR